MGKFSRSKGRREEQQLVLDLAKMGYKAERILRQYMTAGEADVKTLEPEQYTFELKTRRSSFKTIYALYYDHRDLDGVLKFVLSTSGVAVAASTNFKSLLKADTHFRNLLLNPTDSKKLRVYKRIVDMQKLKQTADFLVIKDNNKPRLYFRYWG